MMDIRPILSALGRHRIAAILIAVEIALACAVLCNAFFLVSGRLHLMQIDSGVDERALATLKLRGCEECNTQALYGRMLDALHGIPGLKSAAVVNTLPFGEPTGNAGLCLDSECKQFAGVPHFYTFTPGAAETLGLKVIAGRDFTPADYQGSEAFFPADSQVWITQALAEHLWPGENPLGREFWLANFHFSVAGVLAHFARPDPGRSENGVASAEWSVIVPIAPDAWRGAYVQRGVFVLRADPLDLPRVLAQARTAAERAVPEAIVDQAQSRTLADARHDYFRTDRAMTGLLVAVIVAMLLVTALGIVGLASFWVAQRTKQIGIRRALGATRTDILRYFQIENFLLASGGIVLGMLLAYACNQLLMKYFELARLPAIYLPIGAVLLWLIGQLAVLGPALRAAAIPPVVATRST
jgi:putative ABC transport system permease protein